MSELDPAREGGIVDSIWLLFGWLPSLLYALALYGLRRLFLFLHRRYALSRTA